MRIVKIFGLAACLILTLGINQGVQAGLIGNDVIDRGDNDTWDNFTTIDTSLAFTEDGFVTDWSIWSGGSGDIYLQVFRSLGDHNYKIVGQNYFSDVVEGFNTWSVNLNDQFKVMEGDYIGFSMNSGDALIDFDFHYDNSGNAVYHSNGPDSWVIGVGEIVALGNHYQNRSYSIAAKTVAPVPEPTTMLLFGAGLAGLAGSKLRRKKDRN